MVPRPGLPDTAIFLFYNRCNGTAPTRIDLTNITPTIQNLDTVFFMYRSDSGNGGLGNCGGWFPIPNDYGVKQTDSLFTGPNRAPMDTVAPPWQNFDRHWSGRNENALQNLIGSAPVIPDTFWSLSKNKYVKYGRRWCEAGWIHKDTLPLPGSTIRTDTVEFGFEDQFNGQDIAFEDIRFELTGVFLNYPLQIDSLALHFFPNKDTLHSYTKADTIAAGDSLFFRAVIWGKDTTPAQNIFADSTNLARNVTWQVIKSQASTSTLGLGTGPSNSNTFRATTAYEWDTVVVSYLRFQIKKPVFVKPGSDYRVWIEPDSSINPLNITPSMRSRLQNPDSVTLIQLTSLDNQKTVVAVVRDKFGNFTRFANNSVWTEVRNPGVTISIAAAANGTPLFLGVISRVNPGNTNVQVSAKNLTTGITLLPTIAPVSIQNIPVQNLINDQTFSVKEKSSAGTAVGTVVLQVPDSMNVTLTEIGNVPEFTFNPTTRAITVATGAVLNYNARNSYSFQIAAQAANALNDTATITIQLIQLIPIANLINDQTFSIREKSAGGTTVGTVALVVPDSIHVALTRIDSSAGFTFDTATRIITVAQGAVLDYDTKNSYSIRLAAQATNAYALNDTATITIQLIADSLIPATATLLDTNHNGHIDMIDITWTDPSTMKATLPTVGQLIRTLSIITLANQNDSLHAIALVPDIANKTIHIIISENAQIIETGWDTARISLTSAPVSVKGGYFLVTRTIDGAAAIATAACYSPGSTLDSLAVTFSEPVDSASSAGYLQMITVNTKVGPKPLSGLGATGSGTFGNKMNFVLPAGTISPYDNSVDLAFAAGPPSPAVVIDYCYPLPLIVSVKAGPNPFTPDVDVPPGRQDNDPAHGIRIEILLNSSNTSGAGGDNRPASCTIFDAVGNVIVGDAVLKPDLVATRKKYFDWDGKNKSGMTVAGGTYLARITVEDKKNGTKVIKQVKLGVKTVK
jgi:hypothetical protein